MPALREYLTSQVRQRAADFLTAGRAEGKSFDEIYANLRRAGGDRGLSNSEAALAAGLWGAFQAGATIAHVGLARFFPAGGSWRNVDELRATILASDAILLAGPVYFGDRGSVAQEFIEFLRSDEACATHIRDRVYGGIAVGAKRNGGQETTLIYQLVDMTNLNMLAVGNDAETTSQYGGTAVAGDVGTLDGDTEGILTSIGTGRRVAKVAAMLQQGDAYPLPRSARVSVWLLQDVSGRGRRLLERFVSEVEPRVPGAAFDVIDVTEDDVMRCLACDVCPTDPGARTDYRCIIRNQRDLFARRHETLIGPDGVLLAAYSPVDRRAMRSQYQRFVERTRYLRRDDYVLGNVLTAPFVISEVNSNQNLHIRMLTSFIRQLTVLHHPLIGVEYGGKVLNWSGVIEQGASFARATRRLAAGRQAPNPCAVADEHAYSPVGYVISAEKVALDRAQRRTRRTIEEESGSR